VLVWFADTIGISTDSASTTALQDWPRLIPDSIDALHTHSFVIHNRLERRLALARGCILMSDAATLCILHYARLQLLWPP